MHHDQETSHTHFTSYKPYFEKQSDINLVHLLHNGGRFMVLN